MLLNKDTKSNLISQFNLTSVVNVFAETDLWNPFWFFQLNVLFTQSSEIHYQRILIFEVFLLTMCSLSINTLAKFCSFFCGVFLFLI